ncbi:prepilin-type N-terminal cleavage/methylation domain-containing protein [Jeotgalibaca porci]|uniref:prepilin-type N-terminal cleavage/methylation domain-containing protein n=1 Tax=Jeotgalibaca porci TaxID=1868793 RepID=UPI003F8FD37A
MRNKIKQLLNKEEGFTLVELLAVLAILALIVGIAVPMIGNVVTKSQTNADNAQIELIVDAARLYQIDSTVEDEGAITVEKLIDAKLLEAGVVGTEVNTLTIAEGTTIAELKAKIDKSVE